MRMLVPACHRFYAPQAGSLIGVTDVSLWSMSCESPSLPPGFQALLAVLSRPTRDFKTREQGWGAEIVSDHCLWPVAGPHQEGVLPSDTWRADARHLHQPLRCQWRCCRPPVWWCVSSLFTQLIPVKTQCLYVVQGTVFIPWVLRACTLCIKKL